MKPSVLGLLCAGLLGVGAADLGDLSKEGAWIFNRGTPGNFSIAGGVVTIKGYMAVYLARIAPVDSSKSYKLSAEFKAGEQTAPAFFYFGIEPFTAAKKAIRPEMVNAMENTETVLSASCKAGDLTVEVKDASMWCVGENFHIAFAVKDDFSDLPNSQLSPGTIKAITKKESAYVIELAKAIDHDSSAGTRVRQHNNNSGRVFMYSAAEYKKAPTEWTEISGIVKPMQPTGAPIDAWWRGTDAARVVILANFGKNKEAAVLQVRNIRLEEITDEAK